MVEKVKKLPRPFYDRVLLRRVEPPPKPDSHIQIPDTVKQKSSRGSVLAVGHGKQMTDGTLLPLAVKVGEIVMIGPHAGNDIELEDEKFVVVREDEIICGL